jgi:hypothetical protein
MPIPPVYELRESIGEFGRGERISGQAFQLIYTVDPAGAVKLSEVG